MVTDPAADRGEGIGFQQDFVGVLETFCPDQGNVGRNIHLDGAGILAGRLEQRRTDCGTAVFLMDVLLIFVAEIAEGAEHRIWRRLSETAERRILDDGGHLFEKFDIPLFAFALCDVGQDLQHSFGAFPARGTLPAGLILAEIHEETGHIHGAVVFIHHDQTAGPHDGTEFSHFFIVHGGIEMLDRDAAAGRSSELGCLEFLAFGNAATDIMNNGAQGCSHGNFHKPHIIDITG